MFGFYHIGKIIRDTHTWCLLSVDPPQWLGVLMDFIANNCMNLQDMERDVAQR